MAESIIPKDYNDLLNIIDKLETTIIAGGTDLMVKKRNWSSLPPVFNKKVVFINNIKELKNIYKDDLGIHIGSCVTLYELLNNEIIPDVLKQAVCLMASPAIRHSGTIGGNIGNASPAGDSLPVLYNLNATILLSSKIGEKSIPIEKFILGPGKIDIKENEIIKEIIIKQNNLNKYEFKKVGGRKADAISKVSFCGMAAIKHNIINDFRVSFGAVGPTVVRIRDIENKIIGKYTHEIDDIVKEYNNYINPIDDQRSNAVYRKQCSINLLKDFIRRLN